MPKRILLILLVVLFLLTFGAFFYLSTQQKKDEGTEITSFEDCVAKGNPVLESYPAQCKTSDGKSFSQDIGNEMEMMDIVVIENPRPNQRITSPLVIKGRARGTYFFEATFPVKLLDSQGQVIAEAYVQANPPEGGDWMTEDFVPFIGELTFKPTGQVGTLQLMKANPSGLKENDQTLEVPVIFTKRK